MNDENFKTAAFINLTLQNGNPLVVNAQAIDSITVFGDSFHSAIVTYGSKKMNRKYYVVKGGPELIKTLAETAIKNSK